MQLNKRDRKYIIALLKNKYGQILSTAQDLEDDARKAFFEHICSEWNLLLDLLAQFEQELSKSEIKAIYHNKA
jgi:hypothetical protein